MSNDVRELQARVDDAMARLRASLAKVKDSRQVRQLWAELRLAEEQLEAMQAAESVVAVHSLQMADTRNTFHGGEQEAY